MTATDVHDDLLKETPGQNQLRNRWSESVMLISRKTCITADYLYLPATIRGTPVKRKSLGLILLSSTLFAPTVFGYGSGGGGGGSSCSEPQFSSESPKNEPTVSSLARFSFEASQNTDLQTLNVEVDRVKVEPKATRLNSGDSRIDVDLKDPKAVPSKVRITVRAKSSDGCEAFQPFYIEVKP